MGIRPPTLRLPGRRLRHGWITLLTLLFLATTHAGVVSREPELKAVFLFNFSHFTDWPPEAFPDAKSPLVIGVLGRDSIGPLLDEVVRGEQVNDRPLQVVRFNRVEDITNCQILFISESESPRLAAILAKLDGRSILTVGDMDGFTEKGGMIRFMTVNNHIQLRVNLEAIKAAKLILSSKLLRTAEIVSTTRK